jgi:hypothetical protein
VRAFSVADVGCDFDLRMRFMDVIVFAHLEISFGFKIGLDGLKTPAG